MTVSKIRLPDNTEHDIRAKYLIQSSSSDAVSEEFVTKTTTEDAIANIQKIYGNTIRFNQLVVNGNFDSSGTVWQCTSGSTVSMSNNTATYTTNARSQYMYRAVSVTASHKYYYTITINQGAATSYTCVLRVGSSNIISLVSATANSYVKLSGIGTAESTTNAQIRIVEQRSSNYTPLYIRNVMVVDLTDLYGSGNEPTVAAFEAQYPADYYPYSQQTSLLFNSATAIQSTDLSNNVIGGCDLNIPTLTGKLNGAGSSVVIFPNGMQLNGTTRDELTATTAVKRIADDNSVLVTPEEYILDNALQLQYPVVAGGTEMVLSTSGTAPMKMDVIYGNAADASATMSQNFISVDSMKAFLAALGTQMNGTWAMQYSGGKYTFTFTSN